MPIAPIAAIAQLLAHPVTFMRANLVQIGDFPAQPNGVRQAFFQSSGLMAGQRYGRAFGSWNLHDAQDFTFTMNAPPPAAPHLGTVQLPFVPQQAQFVQMFQYAAPVANQPPPINWFTLGGNGQPDLMITTKLTGCSFLIRINGNSFDCAHIQPRANQTGAQLRNELSALKHTHHTLQYDCLFGRGGTGAKGYSDAEAATVIGVRRNNAWKFYTQRLIPGNAKFKSVERIYP